MTIAPDTLAKDLYGLLGVPRTATGGQIKKAYRAAARRHHPDHNPDPAAEDTFKAVAEAYDVLSDPDKRAVYDAHLDAPQARGYAAGSPVDLSDLLAQAGFDPFETLFTRTARPRSGTDLTATLTLTFHQALEGTTTSFSIDGRAVTARIPAGVADGTRIRLAGQGAPGRGEGPDGDLYLDLSVAPHPVYGRDGAHVTLTVPVTYTEAVLGADIAVPAPDGTIVTVRLPAGIPTGRTLRVRGKGAPRPDGEPGDLLVTVAVDVPNRLTSEQAAGITALAAAEDRAGLRERLNTEARTR